ncbi:Gfo/Idh/MocA family protein [Yoonia sp. I 8.24]|uniref:Gfo/Idh/MocA family protein n=1 Tax=Yoonia sp. I 8.24 TaxID=1537229 RepID=UPI001EE06D03|nr:Gfo/Idh/MocA family oxidoreductase [Yoonia sp. I 8.24]MCG3267056.1 Gfo/Idh/MocA family oxidoreductase [Yoonia sp. I 8.24]
MTKPELPARLGVALIGAGMIAPTHVAALSGLRDLLRLDAVLSRHPENAAYLAETYAGTAPLFTSDLTAITENPDIHIAIVATPPSVRIDLITALASAGKHILLEKPVARNSAEAQEVVEICENAGVSLGILFQHRARAPTIAAMKLLASGDLGKLAHVEIAVPLWRDQSYYDELGRGTYARDGGGVLLTQAIHTIDLALSFTGAVSSVQGMVATTALHNMEAEDMAVAGLRFANGAVGSLIASTASYPHGVETITLHYARATLRIGTGSLDVFWRGDRNDHEVVVAGGASDNGPAVAKHDWHQAIIRDFVDAVRAGTAPMVTGRQALASHHLVTAIEASSRDGRIVNLSLA